GTTAGQKKCVKLTVLLIMAGITPGQYRAKLHRQLCFFGAFVPMYDGLGMRKDMRVKHHGPPIRRTRQIRVRCRGMVILKILKEPKATATANSGCLQSVMYH